MRYPNAPEVYDARYFEGNPGYMQNEFRHMCYAAVVMQFQLKKVLDIGCGHGILVEYLTRLGVHAVGMDFSEHTNHQVRGNAVSLPFGDKVFDMVVSTDLLEHLEEGDVHVAIEECKRVAWRQAHFVCPSEIADEHSYGYHLTDKPLEWWVNTFSKHGLGVQGCMEARLDDHVGRVVGYSYLMLF